MIAVDTSALMAVILMERQAAACAAALKSDPDLVISAATVAEALIVADRKTCHRR
jgi:ribonuclease VapC